MFLLLFSYPVRYCYLCPIPVGLILVFFFNSCVFFFLYSLYLFRISEICFFFFLYINTLLFLFIPVIFCFLPSPEIFFKFCRKAYAFVTMCYVFPIICFFFCNVCCVILCFIMTLYLSWIFVGPKKGLPVKAKALRKAQKLLIIWGLIEELK